MRKITAKLKFSYRVAVLAAFFAAVCGRGVLAASEKGSSETTWRGFYISAAPLVELKNGNFNETTYRTESDTKYTEILWNEELNLRAGASLQAGWWFVGLEADALVGIPKSSGTMSENWWTASFDPEFHLADFDCDTKILSDFEIDSRLKFDIPLFKYVRLRPYAGFSYSLLNMNASDAKGKAGLTSTKTSADGDDAHSYSVSGDRVDYKRETYDIYLGIQAGTVLFDRLTILGDFRATPFLYINTVDHHYADETATPSVTESYTLNRFHSTFPKMTFGGSLEYRIWKDFSLGGSFYYSLLKDLHGEEYTSATDSGYKSHTGYYCQTSQNYWKASLYAKYRFKLGNEITLKDRTPHAKRTKSPKAPKVRHGKIQVRTY